MKKQSNRKGIYDNIVRLLTEYETETHENRDFTTEFYELLCCIRNCWEDTITEQEV